MGVLQCRALSICLLDEKSKSLLFPGTGGLGHKWLEPNHIMHSVEEARYPGSLVAQW